MDQRRNVRISKYLARHLRHNPAAIGLTLDAQGWVDVEVLIEAASRHGFRFSRDELTEVVTTNDKQRYAFDASGTRIRASQGHSVDVDLGLPPAVPPAVLFHGTIAARLGAIHSDGLKPMSRQHVHLSPDRETATRVGARRGRPVILTVDARGMHDAGHVFHVSDNGVWLAPSVPPGFITFPDRAGSAPE